MFLSVIRVVRPRDKSNRTNNEKITDYSGFGSIADQLFEMPIRFELHKSDDNEYKESE